MGERTARSAAAEAAFRQALAELGAELLESQWLGSLKAHRIRCALGHECAPRPAGIQQGQGICRACAGHDPAQAEAAFRIRLAELGATLLEPRWLGADRPHGVQCAAGHACEPRPGNVRNGQGICRKCARNDTAQAESDFLGRLQSVGAVLLEPYVNNNYPHAVRCRAGHECLARPGNVQQGWGFCATCAGQDAAVTEMAFRARVEQQQGTVLGCYVNSVTPVRIRCREGHEGASRPGSVLQGRGFCRACAGNSPEFAELKFRARLAELGATLLEPYSGNKTPVRVRCAEGHDCRPQPGGVIQGQGVCTTCAGKIWDAFYVVTSEAAVKFGITSGNGRPRLRTHRAAGYRTTVRLLPGLPGDTAPEMERAVMAALRLAGFKPVYGREHFSIDALALVLDIVDNYLTQEEMAS